LFGREVPEDDLFDANWTLQTNDELVGQIEDCCGLPCAEDPGVEPLWMYHLDSGIYRDALVCELGGLRAEEGDHALGLIDERFVWRGERQGRDLSREALYVMRRRRRTAPEQIREHISGAYKDVFQEFDEPSVDAPEPCGGAQGHAGDREDAEDVDSSLQAQAEGDDVGAVDAGRTSDDQKS
jgi:hypothetical protein